MIDFTDKANLHLRLSNSEREEANASLAQYAAEGRLSQPEVEERSAQVRLAVTRADLAPVFADLPVHDGAQQPVAPPPYGNPGQNGQNGQNGQYPGYTGPYSGGWRGWEGYRSTSGQRWPAVFVALSPFVALILFFITGFGLGFGYAWLWFLLVPIAGILSWGIRGGSNDHDRR